MGQISPPLRILLVGAILFMGVYMVALRPKGDSAAPAPAPTPVPAASQPSSSGAQAHTTLGKDVQKARDAAQTASAAGAASAGESTSSASASASSAATPAATTAAKPSGSAAPSAAKPATSHVSKAALPVSVAKALAARKVMVLYFWNPKAADDRAVRRELRHVDRHKGAVVVHVANVRTIARYAPIAKGVDVQQSPATVVIDRKLRGTLLTGYVDRVTVDQAVSDALHAH